MFKKPQIAPAGPLPTADSFRLTFTHHAWLEGRDGAAQGYTGPNPYLAQAGDSAMWWRDGYLAEIKRRLDSGESALSSTNDARISSQAPAQ